MLQIIKQVVEGHDLTFSQATEAMRHIMEGDATDAQIAAFLTALRMKGETAGEIAALATVMRDKAVRVSPKSTGLLDTCGTGGDSKGSFNISTTVAFVAAAGGIKVAKHGNRSVSSMSGSADVLETLGVDININPEKVAEGIDNIGIGFLFAPVLHKAMKYAITARKEISIRTVFNILGPLTNPASAPFQLIGVYDRSLVPMIAEVLKIMGSEKAAVVHGDGFDEITVTGDSNVAFLGPEGIDETIINPEDFGLKTAKAQCLAGGNPQENAVILKSILKGQEKSPKRDAVTLNSAAALLVGGGADSLKDGFEKANAILDSGNAYTVLEKLVRFTAK